MSAVDTRDAMSMISHPPRPLPRQGVWRAAWDRRRKEDEAAVKEEDEENKKEKKSS